MHHFEVGTVAFFSSDRFNLKNLFIVANILTYYTRGRNIIFGWHVYAFRMTSSDPISPMELKAPYEYIAIARLLGLPMDKAYAVVTQNVIDAIAHGGLVWIQL